tara:strand:- start:158 stop:676 length:519 start_codon:yes stop_codon:yes gene_type:complete
MASKRVGDIYKIKVNKDFYIGSTWYFNQRFTLHKSNSKTSDIKLYKAIRDNNNEFEMTLLYEYECYTDTELRMEERRCYDELKPNLNSQRPSVSKEEVVECKHQYHIQNREAILERHKQNYIENRENVLERQKKHRDNNTYICGCGSRVLNRSSYITKHEQTQRHQKYLLQM